MACKKDDANWIEGAIGKPSTSTNRREIAYDYATTSLPVIQGKGGKD